jgi:hypothetical protein
MVREASWCLDLDNETILQERCPFLPRLLPNIYRCILPKLPVKTPMVVFEILIQIICVVGGYSQRYDQEYLSRLCERCPMRRPG